MNKIYGFIIKYQVLVIAVIVATVLRFLWIDRVSPAIGGDELNYILTSRYMALRWSDILGSWNPWSVFIFQYPKDEFQAEISYFLLLPLVKFLPLTVFNVKFVFAILSVSTVAVIYAIANELFGKRVAITAAFLTAINPWSIFLGRTAYEMVPETFFYILAIFLLLRLKGNKIYFSLPILLMAFYSHIATKVIFFPIILSTLIYSYSKNNRRYKKQYLLIGLFAFITTLSFVATIMLNPNFSRTSELINFNDPSIEQTVNYIRKTTIDNKLNYIFTNKITVFINIIISKVAATISPEYLFISGDQFYSIYTHGFFYIIDFIFIILGMLYVFSKNKIKFFFISTLSILSIFPHIIHTIDLDNFVPQISLLFPFLILFCANGIVGVYESLNKKIVLVIIILIYILSLCNFLNIYFYQYPLKETFDFKIRVLSRYVSFNERSDEITVYSTSSNNYFKKYLFYANLVDNFSADLISENYRRKNFTIGKVAFKDCDSFDIKKGISIVDANCAETIPGIKYIKLSRLIDGGANFKIYNDKICDDINLDNYASNIKLSDFSVENLDRERFCKVYITN